MSAWWTVVTPKAKVLVVAADAAGAAVKAARLAAQWDTVVLSVQEGMA